MALLLAVPVSLTAQGDTTFTRWLRFRTPAELELRLPPVFHRPWDGGPRRPGALALAAWDSALARTLDSIRTRRTTAWRLRRLYGARAVEDSLPERRGVLGLSRRYADLSIEGNARLEIRSERLKNLRCTPAQYLDLNSGCRGSWKTPRLDTYLAVRSGGLIGQRLHVDVDYDTERDFTARNNLQLYYQGLEDEVVRRVEVGTVVFRPPASRFITANIPANNFGINATFDIGAFTIQGIAATQKGSVMAERNYTVGNTTVQPQDREARDLDFEGNRFFWVVDPRTLPNFPQIDILQIDRAGLPPAAVINQGDIRVYRYRPPSRTGINPNLGGITAVAIGADSVQRVIAQWELLQRDVDYYVDPTGLWFALAARLDLNDYLAVSYLSGAGPVGTFPAQDTPVAPGQPPRDTLRLIVEPRVSAGRATFHYEMRQVYRVAGADLDLNTLKVNLSLNRSERPLRPGALTTYLAELGLAIPTDPDAFNQQDRLFPRLRDPNAGFTIKESYIVLPTLQPFADPARLLPTERNDSLYRTPGYLLYSEGPPAKFVFRLRYNASSSADRSTLDLGALSIRDGSESLFLNGRRLEKGIDYSINYDLGQVTFTDPQALFGASGASIQARFEERGVFAVAPTQIYGISTRYNIGEVGGINLLGLYQVEQSAFNRPALGFEAQAHMVGGISSDFRFRPGGVTRFLNRLTSAPATAPSRLDLNAEVAFTRPDPNRSGQAYLEEFEGDPGVQLSLRETLWEFGSRPQFADGVETIVGQVFDTDDAVQMTWQNLVPDGGGGSVQLRARDIDPKIQVAGQQDQLETVLFMTLAPDTAGGQVDRQSRMQWTLPTRLNAPRWRSMVTSLSSTGVDLSKNEYLEFWVFRDGNRTTDSAGLQLVVDLGVVSEDAIAMAPESLSTTAGDSVFTGRQLVGLGRLDTERQPTGVFNAATDDVGILGDRPDLVIIDDEPRARPSLCRQELSNVVPVYPWGDLGSRCTNGNGALDAEDLDNDNQLDATGSGENVLRWVIDPRTSPYFVRVGAVAADSGQWQLYRVPLRTPEFTLGTPNIRLVKHLRVSAVAAADQGGPDKRAFWALARMRFLGSPWVRRSEQPVASIAGATGAPTGEVVASTVSTENTELGYTSPPGVRGGLDKKGGSQGEFGSQVNERSLRVLAREIQPGQRAEAYYRFPSGPQNLLRYRELRAWARGRGPGWDTRDFEAYIRVGSDSRNFYQFIANAATTTWEPEFRVELDRWRELRARIESRRLQGLPADSAARVACGGDTVSVAYVLCDGPYLAHIEDPAVNPPNLAQVQEVAAGIYRRFGNDATDSAEVWIDDIRLTEPISRVGSAVALDARLVASDVADVNVGYLRQDGYFQQIGQDPTYRTTGTLQLATSVRADRFLPTALGIILPIQVSYARTSVTPELLANSDIEGGALARLRRPESWSLNYSFAMRRARRGQSWLVRGLVDPLSLTGSFSDARSTTELSQASNNAHNLQATYLLQSRRRGPTLNLGGLVGRLPGFLRNSEAGKGLNRPVLSLTPTSVRLGSGLVRSEGNLFAYAVPVRRALDSQVTPSYSLTHTWRNNAGLTWQPLGLLTLGGDLASTRDLRRYSDSTALGRVAGRSRRDLFGMDVGVERDRQLTTSLLLAPRLTSWVRPRYLTTSNFVLSRSLTSRQPIREDGDTAGAFILPQTLNSSRMREVGAGLEVGRLVAMAVGDSSGAGRALRRLRPFDVSDRLTRNGTFDLAAFDPSLRFQLGLGGLDRFLRSQGDSAIGAAEVRNTTFQSGADLPFGLSFQLGYSRVRTNRFQRTGTGFLTSETHQREWPRGNVRLTRAIRGFPVSLVGIGANFRTARGSTSLPAASGGLSSVSRQLQASWTPDIQLTFKNGIVVSGSWAMLSQENLANGNLTRLDQDDITAAVYHSLTLPRSFSRTRRIVRSQLTGLLSRSTSCLELRDEADCRSVSDNRRKEFRVSLDTDLGRLVTGGLQFSYSRNEARHLDRAFSQMTLSATFQLSLYSGDYR